MDSSCHSFQTPETPVEFKKISIVNQSTIKDKEEFHKEAAHYMSTNQFAECFPPQHYVKNNDMKRIIEHLFASKSNSKKVLVGYSYMEHLKIYGYSRKDLGSFSGRDHSNTILFFDNRKTLVVVYIKVCRQEATIEEIKKASKMCDEFAIAFLLLYEKEITDGLLSIYPFVALPTISSSDFKDKCPFIDQKQDVSCFLFEENLQTPESLKKSIDNSHIMARDDKKNSYSGTKPKNGSMYERIVSDCMTTMALTDAYLPRLSRNINTQVLTLLLNIEQYKAINDPNEKRIIRGPFGSGKSLILEKIAEKLISTMESGDSIFYIMSESYSLLEAKMEEVFSELAKKNETSSIKLCSTNIDKLLEEINYTSEDNRLEAVMRHCLEKSNNGVVHFLFDEVDPAYFNEKKNAIGLGDYISDISPGTSVILAFQCTEKKQTIHKSNTEHNIDIVL